MRPAPAVHWIPWMFVMEAVPDQSEHSPGLTSQLQPDFLLAGRPAGRPLVCAGAASPVMTLS